MRLEPGKSNYRPDAFWANAAILLGPRRKQYPLIVVDPREIAQARTEHPNFRGIPTYVSYIPVADQIIFWPTPDRAYDVVKCKRL